MKKINVLLVIVITLLGSLLGSLLCFASGHKTSFAQMTMCSISLAFLGGMFGLLIGLLIILKKEIRYGMLIGFFFPLVFPFFGAVLNNVFGGLFGTIINLIFLLPLLPIGSIIMFLVRDVGGEGSGWGVLLYALVLSPFLYAIIGGFIGRKIKQKKEQQK